MAYREKVIGDVQTAENGTTDGLLQTKSDKTLAANDTWHLAWSLQCHQ